MRIVCDGWIPFGIQFKFFNKKRFECLRTQILRKFLGNYNWPCNWNQGQ